MRRKQFEKKKKHQEVCCTHLAADRKMPIADIVTCGDLVIKMCLSCTNSLKYQVIQGVIGHQKVRATERYFTKALRLSEKTLARAFK